MYVILYVPLSFSIVHANLYILLHRPTAQYLHSNVTIKHSHSGVIIEISFGNLTKLHIRIRMQWYAFNSKPVAYKESRQNVIVLSVLCSITLNKAFIIFKNDM